LGALPTCTYGGDYIVTLMNEIAVAPALLLVVFVECIAVSWFYGKKSLIKKNNES
jgi:solute carrier family 6 serotonin transporter-like protein 4